MPASPPEGLTQAWFVRAHRSPHPFFTPTHLNFADASGAHGAEWQSRKARKGRYAPKATTARWSPRSVADRERFKSHTVVKGNAEEVEKEVVGRMKQGKGYVKPGLRMDVSFWEAALFTFGSAVWVCNGFTVWFPILRPALESNTYTSTSAALAFIGGSIFETGSYLMVVEALDRGREITFGTALGELLHHHRRIPSPSSKSVRASHDAHDNSLRANGHANVKHATSEHRKGAHGWIWWGSPMWHDLGYLAGIIQLCAATIFWISTLTGLPGVITGLYDGDGSTAIIDVFFWTPQVVGGMGFMISSAILMIEVQTTWYLPKPLDIGWQVGFWNLLGAVGFTLCGALGYSSSSGPVYQSGLSTWWGSWAFLIGSGFQIWEVVFREPQHA